MMRNMNWAEMTIDELVANDPDVNENRIWDMVDEHSNDVVNHEIWNDLGNGCKTTKRWTEEW